MKWIHQAATILDNEEELPVLFVQQRFGAWIIFMSDHREQLGSLGDSMNHLLKITRSYWSGLFHCYQVENLPKTNNDLEQVFGSFRHHQRRTTGRKKAPASLLIRGSSRLISAVVTRIKTFTATDLATVDLVAWRDQRSQLELLREKRLQQRRFRRDPEDYLLKLETKFIQSILPP
ncbi:MAG: hypothetical protein QNJ55_35215 [Xenococcus sp. MO_188.B8]|nr:hypothetical protein [Xenococcus sp. MO_188.B8]